MNPKNQTLATYFLDRANHIAEKWLSLQSNEAGFPIYVQGNNIEETKKANIQMIQVLASRLEDQSHASMINWSEKAGENAAELGIPINDKMRQFKLFRAVLLGFLEEYLDEQDEIISHKRTLVLGNQINEEIDLMIEQFAIAYFQYANNRLKLQEEVISELSTPVISITDGIAVLPLIGDIDAHRAVTIMQHTLHESGKKNVNCLIIDISGILIMDTMVALELTKLISALNLTGIEVSLTGMRPEMAHSLVGSGLKLNHIGLYNNLGQALKEFGIVRH